LFRELLRKGSGVFENDVCRIELASKEDIKDYSSYKLPLFGSQINFQLDECVNCPEYLANFAQLER